jgi:hypothetical protein
MASNQLSGSIPAWLWQHQKLQYIYLFDNGLFGELTRSVTALNLVHIDLSTNQPTATGEIPEDFGNLKNLTLLFACFYTKTSSPAPSRRASGCYHSSDTCACLVPKNFAKYLIFSITSNFTTYV